MYKTFKTSSQKYYIMLIFPKKIAKFSCEKKKKKKRKKRRKKEKKTQKVEHKK